MTENASPKSCIYCGNPKPTIGKKSSRKEINKVLAGLRWLFSLLSDKGSVEITDYIQSPDFVYCGYCGKEYSILCDSDILQECKEFVRKILSGVKQEEIRNQDIVKFMSNESIQPLDILDGLRALVELKNMSVVQFSIIFKSYFLTLIKDSSGRPQLEDIGFLESEIGGGNFLGR